MITRKRFFIWFAIIVSNAILLFITISLQIIGYGTSPKIEAKTDVELKRLVSDQVFEYNKTYFFQMLIIGLTLFLIDYFLSKSISKKALRICLTITVIYFAITLMTLIMISSNFAELNLRYFPNP